MQSPYHETKKHKRKQQSKRVIQLSNNENTVSLPVYHIQVLQNWKINDQKTRLKP